MQQCPKVKPSDNKDDVAWIAGFFKDGKKNFQWGIPKFAIVVKQKCVLSGEYSKFFALQWWQATVVIPY